MLGARAQPDAGSGRRCGWARPAGAGPEDFLAEHYDLNHGSAEVPERLMAGLVRRRQQIGQLEILATIVPYLSMPATLEGRDVANWIDNTSAKAALVHGYSRAPDNSRMVHALHAYNLGLRARPWFEYVRSKASRPTSRRASTSPG